MFRIFLYTILIFIIFNTQTSAFHKNGKATNIYGTYEDTDAIKSKYCAGKVKKIKGDIDDNMQQGYKITNYHQTEPRNASGILSLKRLIQYGGVTENTPLVKYL